MTYLELCKFVHLYTRIGNSLPGTAPTTTVGQTAPLSEIVAFVARAWIKVQNSQTDWTFRRIQDTHVITTGNRTFLLSALSPAATRIFPFTTYGGIDQWLPIYKTSDGVGYQNRMQYIPYQYWRGLYDFGTRPSGQPANYTVKPGLEVEVDPTPDASYTITLDSERVVQTFSADADDPANYPATGQGLPAEYHEAIGWQAVMLYAQSRGDQVMYAMGKDNYDQIYQAMCNAYLPDVQV